MKSILFPIFLGCLYFAQAGLINIQTQFLHGDVVFFWTAPAWFWIRPRFYNVSITRDNEPGIWETVYDTQYSVKDALLYDSIRINVRPERYDENNIMEFTVSKVESKIGDSAIISWTALFFPRAGVYSIYHTDKVNRSILQVTSSGATLDQIKYEYHSRPYDSTNITFEIRDITLDDAGYYNGGTWAGAAWSGGGVVLIVHDKPSKPRIQGNLNIMVGNFSELTCSTKSNSRPDYYARLVSLSYTWFVNNTELAGESNETLIFLITRDHKYNEYSCTATDKLESDRSDPVRINPLYKPDKLTITPKPLLNPEEKLVVKEGGAVGPYNCSADCNPPCDITWKYKDSDGFHDALSHKGTLIILSVRRNIELFLCETTYDPDPDFRDTRTIILDVKYLEKPLVFVNENPVDANETVELYENNLLHLSCKVDSNLSPTIRLSKETNATVLVQNSTSQWLNHTIGPLQCSDTDTYACTAISIGFKTGKEMFRIKVGCDVRIQSDNDVESFSGFRIGLKGVVIVNVPVISDPPPVTSNISWLDSHGQIVDSKSIVLQHKDGPYSHLITNILSVSDTKQYGEYNMLYNGKLLTNISIQAIDHFLGDTEKKKINNRDSLDVITGPEGKENMNIQNLDAEKPKLEKRKLQEEILKIQLEKEKLQSEINLNKAKLMVIIRENPDIAKEAKINNGD